MSNVLRVAIVDPNDSNRESLKAKLLSMEIIWLEAECSRYEFFADVIGQTNPEIGIVCLDSDPEKGLDIIRKIRESSQECSILVISSSTDGQTILNAMRAGAKEFLNAPVDPQELVTALGRIGNQGVSGGKTKGCTVIAVAGSTGGVGATSIAVNLSCAYAAHKRNSVCLIDVDLSLGDADVFLDTIPDYTLVDVTQNVSRLDFTLLKRSLTKHSSGLYLLPRPVRLQDASLIAPADFQRVLGLLKASFSHMVLDISKAYNELDMIALREAREILLVTQLDLPCLRNVVRLMMSFEEEEGLKEKVKIVVNRVGLDNGQISLKKAEETIGREIYWQLPNDYRVMVEVRNNGVPLIEQAPRSSITQSVNALADSLDGTRKGADASSKKAGVGRWLSFWPGKQKSAEPAPAPADDS